MRYLTFGRTGLEVSAIAMGTWQLGGDWGGFDRDRAITAIRAARDAGITHPGARGRGGQRAGTRTTS